MSKQHRQHAPESPKASGVEEKPPEQTVEKPDAPVVTDAPEPPKASGVEAAESTELSSLGSISELERESDGDGGKGREPECAACAALNGERPCSLACFVAAGFLAEQYEQMFGIRGATPASSAIVDPTRNGKPLPDGAVTVRGLRGCVVRVQHRHPGEVFWMLKSRPDDGGHHLGEYACEFADRGDIEIL